MRAIDLYAGIGGWSLGLRLAGVDVVASYEWWQPAIDTHNGNFGGDLKAVDIRKLQLESLPTGIDMVVGSPPCTEFSYANRGGSGDIAEGLKDLVKFFEIVDFLKPKVWAMENVPRVAEVLRQGMKQPRHPLYRFRHLKPHIEVVDFSDFGTPQARSRCIATNIPLSDVKALATVLPRKTLGDVVDALGATPVVPDPVWGVTLAREALTETQAEPPLNGEELRMNREAKLFHPVYNNMAFPEPMNQPARTVTATCTRVSRESLVIADPEAEGQFRRLTIRERASLQGFPITFQFYAKSFSEKAKMIGNAIPPTFTYLLALAAGAASSQGFRGFGTAARQLTLPEKPAPVTPPDREGRTYPSTRSFRAAIPGLRFKSGMRFDLSNTIERATAEWRVRFFFGPSKDIREIDLDGTVLADLKRSPVVADALGAFGRALAKAEAALHASSPADLQLVWARKAQGLSPYDVVDLLGALADDLHSRLEAELDRDSLDAVEKYVLTVASGSCAHGKLVGGPKLQRNALRILAGLVIGDWFNTLSWHRTQLAAA